MLTAPGHRHDPGFVLVHLLDHTAELVTAASVGEQVDDVVAAGIGCRVRTTSPDVGVAVEAVTRTVARNGTYPDFNVAAMSPATSWRSRRKAATSGVSVMSVRVAA